MSDPPLQTHLPGAPWLVPKLWRLPGAIPIDPASWLVQDEAFAGQMALRDHLISDRPEDVLACSGSAMQAASECLGMILETLSTSAGYVVGDAHVERPDGVRIPVSAVDPMATIASIVQEDVCILEPGEAGEHILTAAALCFPAGWTLTEKLGKPLVRIHAPVPSYTDDIARRVQRMFDLIRPETPLMRANALFYERPDLFQPRREGDPLGHDPARARYLRSERQTFRRLPRSGAVVFTIHTYVVPIENLTDEQRAGIGQVAKR